MSDSYGQKKDRRSNDGRAHLYLAKFVDGNAAFVTNVPGRCSEHRQAMRVKFRQSFCLPRMGAAFVMNAFQMAAGADPPVTPLMFIIADPHSDPATG
jgi:hypothetical protein